MHSYDKDSAENKLTSSETLIMKAIWSSEEGISLIQLIQLLEHKFSKKYARTTLETFLLRLNSKGFVKTYRVGRNAYVHALKTEDEYRNKLIYDEMNFWFQGKASGMVAALCENDGISKEEADEIRNMLDVLDD